MKPACELRPVVTSAVPTSPGFHPTPARNSSSASPGTSSRIFTNSTSSVSAMVSTHRRRTSADRSRSAPGRRAAPPPPAGWRGCEARDAAGRGRSRRGRCRAILPALRPRTTTVASVSIHRSSAPGFGDSRYCTRRGLRVRKASCMAAMTAGRSSGWTPSRGPSWCRPGCPAQARRSPRYCSTRSPDRDAMSQDQIPICPASSAMQISWGREKKAIAGLAPRTRGRRVACCRRPVAV